MFVPSVKGFAIGSALAALAVVLSLATPRANAEEMKKKHHEGQKAISLYVINPYQVYQTEVGGVRYFKGGSGWGFGYPYYGNLHINSTSLQVNTNQNNQNNPVLAPTTAYELNGFGNGWAGRCSHLRIRC